MDFLLQRLVGRGEVCECGGVAGGAFGFGFGVRGRHAWGAVGVGHGGRVEEGGVLLGGILAVVALG